MSNIDNSEGTRTSGLGNMLLLILGWLWVAVPLAWGVRETIRTSMALWR